MCSSDLENILVQPPLHELPKVCIDSHEKETQLSCIPDFPGGTVVKNPPANAGDTGSIPGPGRSHMCAEQLSPQATTTEPASHNY